MGIGSSVPIMTKAGLNKSKKDKQWSPGALSPVPKGHRAPQPSPRSPSPTRSPRRQGGGKKRAQRK